MIIPRPVCLGHKGIRSGDCEQEKIQEDQEAEGEEGPRSDVAGRKEARG
jgi:hypothetical protein